MSRAGTLTGLFRAMLDHFGPSAWWPGDTPFEVAVGAVLTQNTAWRNVEKAIAALKQQGGLTPRSLAAMPRPLLEEALRPSGFFRLKAARLGALLAWFATHPGWDDPAGGPQLDFLRHLPTDTLRAKLLSVRGIGPETADCILLYALGRPSFVVDAYTRRMVSRHGLLPGDVEYHELRAFFMDVLPQDVPLFNEFHALIVRTGKEYCKKTRPLCAACPLGVFLEYAVD